MYSSQEMQYLDIFQVQYSQRCRQIPDQCPMPTILSTALQLGAFHYINVHNYRQRITYAKEIVLLFTFVFFSDDYLSVCQQDLIQKFIDFLGNFYQESLLLEQETINLVLVL